MKRFVLRIDIEGVNIADDCSRPLGQDYLVLESDNVADVESLYAVLQNEIKKINFFERRQRKSYTEYTVFMCLEDELFESGESKTEMLQREEWSLGCYTNLKRAKKLMKQAVGIAGNFKSEAKK